jgi:type II secretory pathway pseudopilin PulG
LVVLLVGVLPYLVSCSQGTNCSLARQDLSAIGLFLDRYAQAHGGEYPRDLAVLAQPLPDGSVPPWHLRYPVHDPWKRIYVYLRHPDRRGGVVMSLGSDARPGGREQARDELLAVGAPPEQ